MTPLPNDGATIVPNSIADAEKMQSECPGEGPSGDGRRFKHSWAWKWINGLCTDTLVCSTCGGERDSTVKTQ